MSKPLLIIISGRSCTGKTTLGKKISTEFNLPFVSRDELKESLFDNLGWKDRDWSRKLGIASYSLLYLFIETLLAKKVSFVVESNFIPTFDNEKFANLQKKYQFRIMQIFCYANEEVLCQRFKKRSESRERHPGHVDHLNYAEVKNCSLRNENVKLDVTDNVFDLETTDFNKINYDKLFVAIKSLIIF
ncbi:MAG: AAA family ATPase [Patescibacteria group bacterium]